jgi:uncharacterized protein (DUF433 family)
MTSNLIHDRGRGPEIEGTRITVYNLLTDFLDPTATEDSICRMYDLTPEQVAAARAYVLNNLDTILAEHLEIEARMDPGNPPEVIERAKQTRANFQRFKEWLAERQRADAREDTAGPDPANGRPDSSGLPTFREWLAEQQSRSGEG